MDAESRSVREFWLDEVGPERWYAVDEALDGTVRGRFADLWARARQGALDTWAARAKSCLSLLILLDQFPRNMFRGEARAFATDRQALRIAKIAILRGLDRAIAAPARQFFYLPLMHSESLADQDRCVRLILLDPGLADNLPHARAHRAIIRRFGRFPFRNAALSRRSTPDELAWLEAGGYGAEVKRVGA